MNVRGQDRDEKENQRDARSAPRLGDYRPIAPAISQSPVKKTIARGRGTHRGVMRMRSSFIGVKCALEVKRSMTARPSRTSADHEANAGAPAKPSPRKIRIENTRTIRTSSAYQRRSKTPAAPMPPPMHMVTIP